ncbi:MAG TPA: ribose 5-phosphate isomerase B [Bacteroidales bacterium]|nr:ribose 5-phosphate isomerase B [Bacteroidales bacterium]HPT04240.1 ribose 5-phosphate isomerase B [Bacteroidales bacterium]
MDKNKILALGSDHAGYLLKKFLIENLVNNGYQVKDYGTFSEESVDYPDFAHLVAHSVNEGVYDRGILICGTGNGVNITANKYPKVRSALCWNEEIAKFARLHNDANILALPARFIDFNVALNVMNIFLTTGFEGGRHQRRIEKIAKIL